MLQEGTQELLHQLLVWPNWQLLALRAASRNASEPLGKGRRTIQSSYQVYFFPALLIQGMYQGVHSSKSPIEKIVINLPWQSHPCPTKDTRAEYSSAGREWHSAFCSAEIVLKTRLYRSQLLKRNVIVAHTVTRVLTTQSRLIR